MPEITLSQESLLFFNFVISFVIGLWVKELATNFVSGCIFYFDKSFNEADEVYIDGEKALIVKIGLRTTIFEMNNDRGTIWRYVQNNRIPWLKIEKVVKSKEVKMMEKQGQKCHD